MKIYTTKLLSVLFTIAMLLSLLPVPAQAAGRDPVIEIPTTLAFTTKPQSGTVLKTESYAYTWAINKAADLIVLEIQETNRLTGATSWKQLRTLTGTSGSGTLTYPTASTQILGSGLSTYRISAGILGETAADNELASATFTVTWISGCRVSFDANGGTGTMASEICDIGEEYTLPECAFTAPSRKEFDGWSVGDEKMAVGDTITISENTTVTALWKDIPLAFVTQPKNGTSEKAKPCTFSWQLNYDDATVRLMVYNSGEKEWETLGDDLTGKTSASYSFAGGTYCTGNETQLKLKASTGGKWIESEPFVIVWKDFLTYHTWVLGKPITEENMADVLGDGKISYTPPQGSAPARLTLNSVYIDKPSIAGSRSPIDTEEDLIIELKGSNTVNGQSVAAIYTSCNLYIQSDGTGSLSAYGPNYVIWTRDASISFSGLKELNLSNKTAFAPAVYAYGEISVSDCDLVTSTGSFRTGVLDIILQNSKICIQVGGEEDDPSTTVIDADRAIKIRNAQVEITATVKDKYSGMYARDGITISAGSTVTVTDVVSGIRSGDSLEISDSNVSVSAGESAIKCGSSRTIRLIGCAINTAKTPAEISGHRVLKQGTEEIATDVVIERTSEVTKYKVTVNVNNSKWGSVQVFGLDSTGKIAAGASVTLRATAKAGCRFVGWKVGDTYLSEEPEYSAVITGDTTITAEFTDELVYDTWITGVQVSTKNMNDVLGDGTVSYVPAQGTIPAVLTLKGADLTYSTSPVYTTEELTVEVRGENKLKSTEEYGIRASRMDKKLYINGGGTGSLTIESYDDGIMGMLGKVYLDGLKELDITSGIGNSKFWEAYSIYTLSGLSIKDCTLIRANNCLNSGNGGDRVINMTIDNSRVEVRMPKKGETQSYRYDAIDAMDELEIINGSYVQVEAADPTEENTFSGIYGQMGMEISDSYINVKDAQAGIHSRDITINRSHIYISATKNALYGGGDQNDPDHYYVQLNGCSLTTPNTKLMNFVNYQSGWNDTTKVVNADTEESALVCSIGTTISEVEILGFTPPVSGAVLDKTNVHRGYTEELASYRVNTNAWFKIDPATGTASLMSNGDVFEAGGTYRYRALIVRRDDAFDAFPVSAENLTVTIEGLPAGCEMNVYFNSAGTVLTCDVIFVCPDVTMSGTVVVSGSKATAHVTVENFSDTEAILIIAQYSGGQMKAVQTVSVTADGTFVPTAPFTHAEGCTYKAFLVNADTYAPLCATANLF